ncbi:M14 family zinc carboxypeptidase [Rubrivirga litoralis]|uniref:M14 family zinc carboxypeptidase n=1 Tax=Rubrivirga litoralis TaxID=3075598 RepID=A0ABU3BQF1_9BACT|nr:M14 family zinc carboxypeptidase [Rubrivirga sp. F394]MDT0631513.1 M14 family zinc carboxypeptidase [Rubrivirga sp. F394]
MRLADLDRPARFRTSDDVFDEMRAACEANPDLAQFETIGRSEEGRPIAGVTLGYGPRTVTLVAGAHADEPVGPETLRTLVLEGLAARDWGAPEGGVEPLFERFTFRVVPHVNPDGEARQAWIGAWDAGRPAQTLGRFLRGRRREPPGRDVEFGYPVMRPENAAASRFLFPYAPVALHASLHGMAFSEGALLLIEKDWIDRPALGALKAGFERAAAEAGLRLHDHDRGAEKGFRYGGPGFWTTPEGRAMREHFLAADDSATASKFFLSSMETAVLTGRDRAGRGGAAETPLCLVTELPLFVLGADYEHEPGRPALLERFRERTPALVEAAAEGDDLAPLLDGLGLRCLDVGTAVGLHLRVLDLALDAVGP